MGETNRGNEGGDPAAVPGVYDGTEKEPDDPSFTLEVNGEVFAIRPAENGADYTWLSGPNEGYGFGLSGLPDQSLDAHRENIRNFLAEVDPATGYLEDV